MILKKKKIKHFYLLLPSKKASLYGGFFCQVLGMGTEVSTTTPG